MTARFDQAPWAEAGIQTVRPGVHRVPLPLPNDGLHAVNVYLLEDLADSGIVMIDGGWAIPEARKALEEALAAIDRDLTDISHILVTHIHRDHYTQAVELRRLLGSRVYLGAGERPGLEMLDRLRSDQPVGSLRTLRAAGAGELADRIEAMDHGGYDPSVWEAPDRWLRAGALRFGDRELRVVPTPGHTKGHVVFLDEQRGLLFSGDHVLPHITPSIGFELAEPGGHPLADYLDSLRLMTRYADASLLPAHGPVADSAHTRVAELLAHHDDRLARSLAALGEDTLDAHAVARKLAWTRRAVPFGELTDFNQMLAVHETAAHLDVLVLRGQVTAAHDGGVYRYTRVR
ncbi:MBL fold metallo-hydrolase [Streptomyces rapamycinicus]|uniref:MBL fold metallo-hydrolase n=2 Tax=Streptomyces rapamycinicus TaxID=1226757 RepID=A0A0A0NB59_STRRN|nr:MBL fold metallo-hydrolase [Streptomyces rapamycinicus]AGP53323.1 beta-lactamase [Streptomyces rapamycinicus NRRL 5491]MBB4780809.1 glyoxylase-like metal-dependent hydrolase (beta-lactamase superfamily II) [Streptomyces rapamycinicus]RLV74543.1 MBL fold metallo-hydrolase [Streptomyces rapamycinicus NRRL 5491]UTO61500.1 MBL fold metallo-hydrolase [Streptomyces rapamycinicus]UTP29447.1 MBL fold metallo-hydrolase [Streptomyces rapamycinicus NRRL 5491]